MAKFNTKADNSKYKTVNLAGGEAYTQSDKVALVSLLLTSFVKDQFYRSADNTLADMKNLVAKVDPLFAAKAAIFARDEFGMRSITHALAGELASVSSGQEWAKKFYEMVVSRVDDMTEIMAYYVKYKTQKTKPRFPNSMKKGFANAFGKFDGYQLAKYAGSNKEFKLVDVVNLVHPVPTKRNGDALSKLINGELKNTQTWEAKLSEAGQLAETKEELDQNKSDAWKELIETRKIGYFALLRNLRNIINQAPEMVDSACELLTDRKMIAKSKVLPFRFLTAYDEIEKISNSNARKVLVAINDALEISMINVPKFEGETLVVIDTSASMKKVSNIATLFGAVLAKVNYCDVMTFDRDARYMTYNPSDSLSTIRRSLNFGGGATNFHSIFQTANKKYENIVILSDMAAWVGYKTPDEAFRTYKKRYNADPYVYSFDLAGYGTLQFPENKIFQLAGFSEKVFDIMNLLKEDKNALVNKIESISI